MAILEQFHFWNGFTYRECFIPLRNQGFVYITGPNGSGKSTPWEVFQHTIYGTTTKGLKKNAIVCTVPREDPDEETGFLSEIEFINEAGAYVGRWMIRQSRDHGEYDTAVKVLKEVDGEFREKWPGGGCPKGLEDAQKFAATVFGLRENEFEGCLYLSQAATHTLIEGKPSEKMLYLSYLFGADVYDKIVKELKTRLAVVEEKFVGVPNLEGKLEQLEEQIKGLPPLPELEEKVKNARGIRSVAETNLKKWREKRDSGRDAINSIERREELEKEREALGDVDTSQLEEVKQKLQAKTAERDETRDAIASAELRESLEAEIRGLLKGVDESEYEDLDQDIDRKYKRQGELTSLVTALKTRAGLAAQLKELDSDLDQSALEEQIAFIDKDLAVKKQQYRDGMEQHGKLQQDIKAGVCDRCKRPLEGVNVESLQGQADKLAEELQALYAAMAKPKENLAKLRSQLDEAKKVRQLKQEMSGLPEGNLEEAKTELSTVKASISELSGVKEKITKATGLRSRLAKLPKQDLDQLREMAAKLEVAIPKLEKKKEVLAKAVLLDKQIAKLPSLDREEVENDLKIAEESCAELEKDIGALQRDAAVAEASLTSRRELGRAAAEIETQIAETEKSRRRQKVLQYAIAAVAKLKKRKLHQIVCAIRDVLPRYAGVMFSHEPNTSFIIDDDGESGESLDLIARRVVHVNGRPEAVLVPVKGFSGGEKQRLSVALLFTLHSLLDPSKKPDVLILDEVDKGLDATGIASLMALIGEVKDKYGTVIMTSHRDQIAGARFDRVWRVEKTNEVSTLKLSE